MVENVFWFVVFSVILSFIIGFMSYGLADLEQSPKASENAKGS